jgi:hypothetical protein
MDGTIRDAKSVIALARASALEDAKKTHDED